MIEHLIMIYNIPFDELHMSPLGSGSHSPFPVHVAELCPVSTDPGRQLKVIVLPSNDIR
jgi:hypothetical protein